MVSSPIVRIQNPMQTIVPEQGREQTDGIDVLTLDTVLPTYNLQGKRSDQLRGLQIKEGRVELR